MTSRTHLADMAMRFNRILRGTPLKAFYILISISKKFISFGATKSFCLRFFPAFILASSASAKIIQLDEWQNTAYRLHTQPYSWQQLSVASAQTDQSQGLNLLKWKDSSEDPPAPPEAYNRKVHFGGWLSIKDDSSCLDVRNRVLIRDSRVEIELKPNNSCRILSGRWDDPYTGQVFTVPQETDVDHMVPLKNAYMSGAWSWRPDLRCLYANYMGYRDHLRVVSRRQNIIKSDKDPSQYMPPNKNYRCQYLKNWLTIKLIWRLALRVQEAQAIRQLVQMENCNPQDFQVSTEDLKDQRRKIQNLLPVCSFRGQ